MLPDSSADTRGARSSSDGNVQAEADARWMQLALDEARAATAAGEVPVGAIVVLQGRVIATGRNNPVAAADPSGHAEINALRAAAAALGNYRLADCELFVTLEPCAMCAGAMLHARLHRVVFGAADPRTGAAGSVIDLFAHPGLNHQTTVQGGLLADDCGRLLQTFFAERRATQRAQSQPLREDALRTSDARFDAYPPPAQLCWISDLPSQQGWRMAWLDNAGQLSEAATDAAPPIVCLHGPGQWSHLFRHLWPLLPNQRLLAPDLIGHGRSDKPKRASVHSIDWHAQVLDEWLARLDLSGVTLLVHRAMLPLAQALASRGSRVGRCIPLDPVGTTDPNVQAAWQAPWIDAGHEAALRAWKLRRPPDEDLDANAARRYFAP